jgi:PKD repeat protein
MRISNPSSTKQNFDSTTGLVVLAHHDTSGMYWTYAVEGSGGGGGGDIVAEFEGTPTSGQEPLEVEFTDQSEGDVTSWDWDFGDGNNSSEQDPTHTYTAAGSYTVSLTVEGPDGEATETKTNYITVTGEEEPPVADFSADETSGEAPLTVNFTDLSTGDITSYDWDFGDGNGSTDASPSHVYSAAGTYTVSLMVSGPGGSSTETKTDLITVTDPPSGSFVLALPSPGTAGVPNTFTATGCTPGKIIGFYRSPTAGSTLINRPPCPGGIPSGLGTPVRLFGRARADANGVASVTVLAPIGSAGKTFYFQAVDQAVCGASNLVVETF